MSTPSHLALTSFAPETLAHVLACIACTALPSAALGNAAPAAAEATGDWVGSKTTKAGLEGFFARLLHPTSIATMRLQVSFGVISPARDDQRRLCPVRDWLWAGHSASRPPNAWRPDQTSRAKIVSHISSTSGSCGGTDRMPRTGRNVGDKVVP